MLCDVFNHSIRLYCRADWLPIGSDCQSEHISGSVSGSRGRSGQSDLNMGALRSLLAAVIGYQFNYRLESELKTRVRASAGNEC